MSSLTDYILEEVAKKNLSAEKAATFLQSLENQPNLETTEFAVIGLACRLPDANTPEIFWKNLLKGHDSVGAFPKKRMDDVRYISEQTFNEYNGFQCRIGSYLDQIDQFDHSYFKITAAEARVMDPAQRIFLEVASEAIENAGLTEESLKGSKTAVFVGYSINEDNYVDILPKDDPNIALGNQPSVLAYRLSFLYDMRGPTMVIDTACSSSLVAVHQACQSIAAGDCEQAVVGGVNVRIFPAIREISNLGIEAFDGRCKTFDENANGTNIGDGVAAIILKRKDLAEKDGDYIHAIIKGSAVNSDGNANGITAPNPEAQANVIQDAWKKANIDPKDLSFIETHGTGTKLGDPIEVMGLTHAFQSKTDQTKFCALGAVKTNIGHLEATSGIVGLIKAILAVKNRQLPGNIHFKKANPYIDFEHTAVFPASSPVDYSHQSTVLAGVSSFGISGTNCHLVLQNYQEAPSNLVKLEQPLIFLFSSKQEESLKPLVCKYLDWLENHPEASLCDISYTLALGRNHHEYRLAFTASSVVELSNKLKNYVESSAIDESAHQEDLAKLFLGKSPIYWSRFYPKGSGKKIPLPTYAFHHRRHWPKLEAKKKYSLEERLKSVFYHLEWEREEGVVSKETLEKHQKKRFLCFMHENPEHEAFANYIESKGICLNRVYPAENYKNENHRFFIDPKSESNYQQLVNDIFPKDTKDFGGIIHLWDCIDVPSLKEWVEINPCQDLGAFSLYHIVRALDIKKIQTEWRLVSLTAYAQKVADDDHPLDPTRMPALGINKVISQEKPLVQSLAIDSALSDDIHEALFKEMFATETYSQAVVGFRHGKRYVQTLARKTIDLLEEREASIVSHGVYLIAGGAGYLGLNTAKLLAQKESVKIILTGRKPEEELSQKQVDAIKEIRNLGSEVIYIQNDVTDFEDCKKLISQIEEKWKTIDGIFVAIKNISHKRLDDVSFDEFSSNILAKVKGTWLLDYFTAHLPVRFMATFSSISSLTGGPTGADCSASNLFLDSFGDWRNNQGRATVTMNYTLIEADDGSLLSDRMSMIPPLSREEFLGCLELCITKNLDFAVMADFNSRVMNLVLPFMKIKFSKEISSQFQESQESHIESELESKVELSIEEIITIMQGIWKEVLGVDEVQPNANFFDIGGESISAVKLLHLTNVQLQIQLEIGDLYSYPVLEDLSRSILERMNKKNDKKSLGQFLEDFQSGKLDSQQMAEAYEQLH